MSNIFTNLSLIILIAVIIAGLMRIFRQPLLIGYIFTGIIVGPYVLNLLSESPTFGTFSQIGVALLLFTVGLHLNPKVIKEVGKISLITGIGQVMFTSIFGFLIASLLGFSIISSLYIAIALSFSSTIIIMKLLSDKGDVDSLYGKISIGFLIVQDLIAVAILMIISSTSGEAFAQNLFFKAILIGIFVLFGLFLFSWKLLPSILKVVAKSQEFLFLFSIGWCLALASLFEILNFSLEIGALLAGIAISITPYAHEISAKMRPLRDFFIVLFFIVIGSQMIIGDISVNLIPIIIFSLFILIGNPLIVISIMSIMGYTKRIGFLSGLTVAQISEFSIILAMLGVSVGHLNQEVLSLITVIALITIAGSTYSITYSKKLYPKISRFIPFSEKKKRNNSKKIKNYDAILFGYNRIGFSILNSLKKIKKKYLVIDFNPDTISNLQKFRIPCLYGDIEDIELLNELPLNKIEIAVSTIPDYETNEILIETIRMVNKKAIIIVRAHHLNDALELYKKGADYVLTPHFLGGEYVAKMIHKIKTSEKGYQSEREEHIKMLKKRLGADHKHPAIEKG